MRGTENMVIPNNKTSSRYDGYQNFASNMRDNFAFSFLQTMAVWYSLPRLHSWNVFHSVMLFIVCYLVCAISVFIMSTFQFNTCWACIDDFRRKYVDETEREKLKKWDKWCSFSNHEQCDMHRINSNITRSHWAVLYFSLSLDLFRVSDMMSKNLHRISFEVPQLICCSAKHSNRENVEKEKKRERKKWLRKFRISISQ